MFDTLTRMGASTAGAYKINKSLRFNPGDNANLNRTPSSTTSRTTWTFSFWVKRSKFGSTQGIFGTSGSDNNTHTEFFFASGENFCWGAATKDYYRTDRLFRDPCAWYHIVAVCDTTNGTQADRQPLYVNGARVTQFSTQNLTGDSTEFGINRNVEHKLGERPNGSDEFSGYLAEVHFVDGTALDHTSFGETDEVTGQWIPKKYTGSHGTNGFYLDFKDTSALGTDQSTNSNNWTPNNFSTSAGVDNDSLTDTPTNNWCTWNPLVKSANTFTEGNLKVTCTSSTPAKIVGTIGVTSGKWYFEEKLTTVTNVTVGVTSNTASSNYLGVGDSISFWPSAASGFNVFRNSSNISSDVTGGSGTGTNWAIDDIIGIALDMDNKNVHCYKNGTLAGTVSFSSFGSDWDEVYFGGGNYIASQVYNTNFGQRDFSNLPAGYKALCTNNLPEPTIKKSTDHFNTILYTGNGNASQSKTVGFQPDLVWIKSRSFVEDHMLYDSIRGTGKDLRSNLTNTEGDNDQGLNAFNSDGFTIGTMQNVNKNNKTYVAWCWKAGGSPSSNSDGTITSSVSANATAGFSIVSYTGNGSDNATIGHGLGVAPNFVVIKNRDSGGGNNWYVFHSSLDSGDYLKLNQTSASAAVSGTSNGGIGSVDSDTVNFTQGSSDNDNVNQNGDDYIAYCFSNVEGYSKTGTYYGNGNSNGTTVYTGFRPVWVMVKRESATSAASGWLIYDNKRNTFNQVDNKLAADSDQEENDAATLGVSGANDIDFLSNGFKLRSTNSSNKSGNTYIYLAFAKRPFKYANAR